MPSLAECADLIPRRDARVIEEHLIERLVVIHLPERPHGDTRLTHVDHEETEPGVLGNVPVGAGHEDAHVCVVGAGVPHLLPIDDPLVAVTYRCGGGTGEVRSRSRFAEQLAPGDLTTDGGEQVAPAQVVRAVLEDRRCRQLHAESERYPNGAEVHEGLGDHCVGPRRPALAVPALRPRGCCPSAGRQQRAPLEQRHRGVPVPGDPTGQFGTDTLRGQQHGFPHALNDRHGRLPRFCRDHPPRISRVRSARGPHPVPLVGSAGPKDPHRRTPPPTWR